ncbi:kinesin-like protein KIN-UB [Glycine max]|uniref:kinesin-like protein KIN-UB n=1 Tax=Glycine max TaxID=3847 RepID=UPI0003DEB25D|nr:kinesin-like protein KIN-UB [Glycine max]|eukprot:XP_006598476.1 kinesin-like protein KIN-UB [Glycine max]
MPSDIVHSVLDGYNGIVMAYGQTRIGKTFTLGQLGEEDTSDRGIMVCSMEDILADISLGIDFVTVSYLQLYMEALQDFLNPANDNIPIVEDPKTGDVSLSGDTSVEIKDQPSFLELLRVGETHRIAANTKLNTESSHSHAILTVHVKRFVVDCEDVVSTKNNDASHLTKPSKPIFRKSKLERARTIRASLIVTISLSPYHQGETSNTILFGQKGEVSSTLTQAHLHQLQWLHATSAISNSFVVHLMQHDGLDDKLTELLVDIAPEIATLLHTYSMVFQTPMGLPPTRDQNHAIPFHLNAKPVNPKLRQDVKEFVRTCTTCQQAKYEHVLPTGLLQPLPIPNQIDKV